MDIRWKTLRTQKAGNSFSECEDWASPLYQKTLPEESHTRPNVKGFCFAVGDGATEGMLSGRWAQILSNAYCHTWQRADSLTSVFEEAHRRWARWLRIYLRERQRRNRPIQWYEEPGLERGAYSTLLGFSLSDSDRADGRPWKAIAVGDSCLFHVRGNALLRSFPLENSSDFSNSPMLLCTRPEKNEKALQAEESAFGTWQTDDLFLLMTDAVAAWFLQEYEAGNSPWVELSAFSQGSQHDAFVAWADELRRLKRMRNDDITLTHIEVAE